MQTDVGARVFTDCDFHTSSLVFLKRPIISNKKVVIMIRI